MKITLKSKKWREGHLFIAGEISINGGFSSHGHLSAGSLGRWAVGPFAVLFAADSSLVITDFFSGILSGRDGRDGDEKDAVNQNHI